MEGVTRPALSFLPFGMRARTRLSQDKEKARELLDDAGFPGGKGFPVVKLLVNRNDTQQRIARSIARMWKQNLNIETEIVVKDAAELEMARKTGDFDLIRRGVVLPTSDESANFMAIFDVKQTPRPDSAKGAEQTADRQTNEVPGNSTESGTVNNPVSVNASESILTEEEAMYELRAIPLYFPTSFSLVRPYVSGFEMNSLDALSLSNVMIDNDWRPKNANGESE